METKRERGLPASASTVYSPSVIKRPIRFNDRINEPRRLIRDPRAVRVLYKRERARTHTHTHANCVCYTCELSYTSKYNINVYAYGKRKEN